MIASRGTQYLRRRGCQMGVRARPAASAVNARTFIADGFEHVLPQCHRVNSIICEKRIAGGTIRLERWARFWHPDRGGGGNRYPRTPGSGGGTVSQCQSKPIATHSPDQPEEEDRNMENSSMMGRNSIGISAQRVRGLQGEKTGIIELVRLRISQEPIQFIS